MTAEGRHLAQQLLRTLIETSEEYAAENLTNADIERHAVAARGYAESSGQDVDDVAVEELVGWAEMHFNVRQAEAARLLGDEVGHEPWVKANRAELFPDHGFWGHYRKMLEPRLPSRALARLDVVTDDILDELEHPARTGQWDRRGLVIGHVQSGKTNNYLGLIAKAADAGYRLIVVLAGVHNNLRAQTQQRLDEAVIGRDTRQGEGSVSRIGVGLMPGHPPVLTMTSASDKGDFRRAVADNVGNPFADIAHPTVFVIKKHVSILENLHAWLEENSNRPLGHERISGVPLLLIDDEADNASIDTADHGRDEETDPTRTNYGIRRILNLFDQSAYVGYTATPFANVFIDDVSQHADAGEDLFPRDFIFALEAPSNYVGPKRVFGLGEEEGADDETGLPMVTNIEDSDVWMPPSHTAAFRPSSEAFPKSLEQALDAFVLACAARRHRGQLTAHNSMLVHVTRFTAPQREVRVQVEDRILDLRNEILYAGDEATWQRLESVWNEKFQPMALALQNEDHPPNVHSFDELKPHLADAVAAIQVREINGTSADVLDYKAHRKTGLSVVVIGGAKLSRGLTLEGLTISYYLRATRMYDTLMQMGRWFGYRPGYLDLCRVYTSPEVKAWYKNIASATEDLLADLRTMQGAGARPREFGLRVRNSTGMMITSAVKMRNGARRKVNFGERRPEVTSFEIDPRRRALALRHFDAFVAMLEDRFKREIGRTGDLAWRSVDANAVISYLENLASDSLYPHSISARPGYLADYIRRRKQHGGLVEWTVLLKSSSDAGQDDWVSLAGGSVDVGLSQRTDRDGRDRYAIKSLIGSADEAYDLTDAQREAAASKANGKNPSGRHFRQERATSHGLLILYLLKPDGIATRRDDGEPEPATHIPPGDPFAAFCVSFPTDPDNTLVEYTVNNVYERAMAAEG